MTFTVSIIGIDGSGKSTVTPLLAKMVTAELNLTTVAVGEDYWGNAPEEDLFRPGFMPEGTIPAARLARLLQRAAKTLTNQRRFYPLLKLGQLLLQERTARILARAYQSHVTISDGHLLLSAAGRIINYLDKQLLPPQQAIPDLESLYHYITAGKSLPSRTIAAVPGLKLMRWLYLFNRQVKGDLFALPDALILLDVEPEIALARLRFAGQPLDRHENFADLRRARLMYQRTVGFFCRRRGKRVAAVLNNSQQTVEQTLAQALEFMRTLPLPQPTSLTRRGPLGSIRAAPSDPVVTLKKALNPPYLFRYLLPNLKRGTLKELTFPFSTLGQLFLREGYSAALMQAIYTSRKQSLPRLDQYFLQHPLHQAVYHRFRILNFVIETELRQRLLDRPFGDRCKVLTAPSGYALDLLQPLERFVAAGYDGIWHMKITASDLDTTGDIEKRLRHSMAKIGVGFHFIRGDLTAADLQKSLVAVGPYDIVLFIGFSSWIAKPQLIHHLKLIAAELLVPGGILITDCFSPDTYALPGKYIGYKANYYDSLEFSRILTYCGFADVAWISAPNSLNHTYIAHRPPAKMNALYDSFMQQVSRGYAVSNLKICSPGSITSNVAVRLSTSSRSVSGVA
jgi:thymidylate kinase